MKIFNQILLFFGLLLFFSCSEDESEAVFLPPVSIQASFDYSISDTDPFVLILNNTTQGDVLYKSVWVVGVGNWIETDTEEKTKLRYSTPGEYDIKLYVSYDGLTTLATKTIIVNENGICPDGICTNESSETLRTAATTFSVGTITRSSRLKATGSHTAILKKEFSNLTAEYEMKMDVTYPVEGTFNFSAADEIVSFANENDMNMHGHALIWHNATPAWVENFSGTNAEFEDMIEVYITTVVTRYKGKVRSWDVVNEALEDGSGHPLRNSVFREKMGADYIKKCFQFARNADANALLFYNDYNMTASATKRAAMFDLVDDLGDLIDGVGAQMHISHSSPSASQIQSLVDGVVSRGLKLHFSELDIRANVDGDASELTATMASEQRSKYKEVVRIYNAIPLENKFALTVWGVRDNESWLIDFWENKDWPLLFDENYTKKQAYFGFLEGLQ